MKTSGQKSEGKPKNLATSAYLSMSIKQNIKDLKLVTMKINSVSGKSTQVQITQYTRASEVCHNVATALRVRRQSWYCLVVLLSHRPWTVDLGPAKHFKIPMRKHMATNP